MSRSQNPMTGHMNGSMANFNTYTRHGENIISSKAFDRKDAHTVSQIAQRASFKLIVNAYKSFGGIPKTSFPEKLATQTAFNAFVQANLPTAINKTGTVPVIDYSKLLASKGTLLKVEVPTAVAGEYSDESVQPFWTKVYNCGVENLSLKSNNFLFLFSHRFAF